MPPKPTYEELEARVRRLEKDLQDSRQIINTILDAAPVRIFWKDKDLRYLGCNTLFAKDAGFDDPKDMIGKDDYQMVWKRQAELYRGDDQEVIQSGKPKLLIEEPQTGPDGAVKTLLTSKVPLFNEEGELKGMLGAYSDITEWKEKEAEYVLVQRKLDKSDFYLSDNHLYAAVDFCSIYNGAPPQTPEFFQA